MRRRHIMQHTAFFTLLAVCLLHVVSCLLHAAVPSFPFPMLLLLAACCMLHTACCRLHADCCTSTCCNSGRQATFRSPFLVP